MKCETNQNTSADRLVEILTKKEKTTKPVMECAGYGDRFDKYNWVQVGEIEIDDFVHDFIKRRSAYFELKSMIRNSEDRGFRKEYKKHLRKISKPRTLEEQDDRFVTGCLIAIGTPAIAFWTFYGWTKYTIKSNSS